MLHRKETAKLLRLYRLCSGLSPNITGNGSGSFYGEFDHLIKSNGGVFVSKPGNAKNNAGAWTTNHGSFEFNASASAAIFGEATTVQPNAFQALIIIKV